MRIMRKSEDVKWDLRPMLRYEGKLYYWQKTIKKDDDEKVKYDGKVQSSVESHEVPKENNQSNFGIYQYKIVDLKDGEKEIYVDTEDGNWIIFSIHGD